MIDPNELNNIMYHNAFEIDSDMQKWDSGCWIRYKMFENAMKEVQKVDVEPVRYAKWVKSSPLTDTEKCSLCNYNIQSEELETPYCPICGARMEGV